MSNILEKRLKRANAAREQAEKILENKSRELFLKNQELEDLNNRINSTLELKVSELKESEAQRFTLFQNSVMGTVLTLHGKILKANETFAQLLGYKLEDVIGLHIEDVSYKDDVESSITNTEALQEKQIGNFTMEKRYKRKNNTFFWANTHVSPVRDENGVIKYHLAIIENIHDKKIAEQKRAMLVHHLKEVNESLENFAHVVSHDLKSPLTGINTILNWLERYELDDEVKEFHEMMKAQVLKMYTLIDNVIAYSKVNSLQEQRQSFSITDLVDECIQFLVIPLHIKVELKGNFPTIIANKTKLQQVFSNLIDNAVRYINKEEGLITVTALEDDNYWIFKVKDNGKGIEQKYFSKIFAIFETADTKQQGTGIGLSLVKKIINQYQGTISVNSVVNEFTEFTFSFAKSATQ